MNIPELTVPSGQEVTNKSLEEYGKVVLCSPVHMIFGLHYYRS